MELSRCTRHAVFGLLAGGVVGACAGATELLAAVGAAAPARPALVARALATSARAGASGAVFFSLYKGFGCEVKPHLGRAAPAAPLLAAAVGAAPLLVAGRLHAGSAVLLVLLDQSQKIAGWVGVSLPGGPRSED